MGIHRAIAVRLKIYNILTRMGSVPSEDVIRALEREAYAALLRAIYANPQGTSDPLVRYSFLWYFK